MVYECDLEPQINEETLTEGCVRLSANCQLSHCAAAGLLLGLTLRLDLPPAQLPEAEAALRIWRTASMLVLMTAAIAP